MKIILYTNKSPKKKVTKTLTNSKELTGELKNDCNIVNPDITISIENPSTYNYFYIPQFHRYYFMTDAVVIHNNLWRISGHTDPLMSAKSDLLNNTAVVDKIESGGSNYIDDGSWETRADSFIQATQMSGELGNYRTFLMLAGKPIGGI